MIPRRTGPLSAAASIVLLGLAAGAAPAAAQEVLPWAGKPLTPPGEAQTAAGSMAVTEEAAAQCSGQFEAACRDLKTCAWVADVALEDGTLVPARCVARPPAPPKKAAKKPPPAKPKEAAAAPETEGAAPAAKSSVARSEPEGSAAQAPAATKAETAPAVATEQAAPAAEKAEAKVQEAKADAEPAPAQPDKQPEKKAEPAKSPIVVTAPPPADRSSGGMPSFGAITPVMPGGSGVVTTTVPPTE